jgi:arylsulfatase A-like enzyme
MSAVGRAVGDRPNFVVILTDDLGFGDIGCYGASDIATENLDRMASRGLRFESFCVAAPTCTPSRAALLTGCYPARVGLPAILLPWSRTGLAPGERTIADVLKTGGYATACYGKWHLGHHPEFLPTRHGFDEYFGIPYSNDMWLNHPVPHRAERMLELPLLEGEEAVELNPDQRQLTTWYTERSVSFIERNHDRPFFLYLPHSMPHVPLHVSERFEGKSGRGLYGDVIMEIDWSVGMILQTLERLGLAENTLVLFTSDNGPWIEYGDHGGSAGPLREGKWTTFDGGQRVPAIVQWPGRIPAGRVVEELVSAIDLLPTFAHLAGAELPERAIDGQDVWPILAGDVQALRPERVFLHYRGYHLEAVRQGRWKLHFPHTFKHLVEAGAGGKPGTSSIETIGLALFDLEADQGEGRDVASAHPEVVSRLSALAREGSRQVLAGRRAPGEVEIDGVVRGARLFRSGADGGRLETGDGERLLWLDAPLGSALRLGLPVPATAAYELTLAASGEGLFRISLAGEDVALLRARPDGATEGPLLCGTRDLAQGVRRLALKVVEAGDESPARLDIHYVRIELPH